MKTEDRSWVFKSDSTMESANLILARRLCIQCYCSTFSPTLSWYGDGFGCKCHECGNELIPMMTKPEFAMIMWNVCVDAKDFTPEFQAKHFDRLEAKKLNLFMTPKENEEYHNNRLKQNQPKP